MPPFVSVVTPVFNNTRYLPTAVESVLEQTFQDWELILVNDGSTDGTGALIDQYADRDPRIHAIHHKQNQWIYAAMNTGVAAAIGEYILILNSDDTLEPYALELSAGLAKAYEADMVYHPLKTIDCTDTHEAVRSRVTDNTHFRKKGFLCKSDEIHEAWLQIWATGHMSQANLYRASLMKGTPFGNTFCTEDALFNLAISSSVTRMVIADKPIYNWFTFYEKAKNTSYKYHKNSILAYHLRVDKARGLLEQWNMTSYQGLNALFMMSLRYLVSVFNTMRGSASSLRGNEISYALLNDLCDTKLVTLAESVGKREELDKCMLKMLMEILLERPVCTGESMSFLYEYICVLLKDKKSSEDVAIIEKGLSSKNNPFQIGKSLHDFGSIAAVQEKLLSKNRVIGYGVLGRRAERCLEWAKGTLLESDILWDKKANDSGQVLGKIVSVPDFTSICPNDIILVYPVAVSILNDVMYSTKKNPCTIMDSFEIMQAIFYEKYNHSKQERYNDDDTTEIV